MYDLLINIIVFFCVLFAGVIIGVIIQRYRFDIKYKNISKSVFNKTLGLFGNRIVDRRRTSDRREQRKQYNRVQRRIYNDNRR